MEGHYETSAGVRLSVRLSVCPVPRSNSRKERPRKPNISKMEVHHMSNPWTYLEIKSSKVKITRPINVHTVNSQYLPSRKAYEHQTWYTNVARRPASPTSAVTSEVKGQGRKFTWCIWRLLADTSGTKRYRNTKIGRKIAHPTGSKAYWFQGQRSRSPGRLMMRPEVHHIFGMRKPIQT